MIKHNDRNIKEVLSEMIGTNAKVKKGFDTMRIQDAWKSEMGNVIVSYTYKIWYKGGTLSVTLTSAPLRSELSMSKVKVMKLINDACKEELVKEIIFR